MTTEYEAQQEGIKALKNRIRELEEEITFLVTEMNERDSEYEKLRKDSEKLAALEAAGVDNWEWYGDAVAPLYQEEEE